MWNKLTKLKPFCGTVLQRITENQQRFSLLCESCLVVMVERYQLLLCYSPFPPPPSSPTATPSPTANLSSNMCSPDLRTQLPSYLLQARWLSQEDSSRIFINGTNFLISSSERPRHQETTMKGYMWFSSYQNDIPVNTEWESLAL